jgi:hypothetical protein
VIAEKLLACFDKLIGLILSDDAPRSKRLTALSVFVILIGCLCIAGGMYGIGATAVPSPGKASVQIAVSVEVA